MIEFINVSKSYAPDIKAMDNVSLFIKSGSIFGIIGLSGAGKSTLIRTINGLEAIDQGEIIVDEQLLTNLTESELRSKRQKIGIIFQHFNLLAQQSVLNNVLLPLKIAGKKDVNRANELLEMVGLSDKKNAYPSQLSGGQQQRVAIARALANRPRILLCDEATSALDPQTTNSILDLLADINRKLGITIVMVTHQMSVIERICDEVAIMDAGQVVETGKVSEIFQKPQSAMGKALIYPQADIKLTENQLRLTFDGNTTSEPIIANMVLTVGIPVNILFADMKTLNNQMVGQLILELPPNEMEQKRMCEFLTHHHIAFEKGGSKHV